MIRIKITALLLVVCMMLLSACGGSSGGNDSSKDTGKSKNSEGTDGKNNGQNASSAGSSAESDFPFGLIRISDTGDGKLVFIIDTTLIEDDLSGVVQCEMDFGEYSVNYIVWGENSLNCCINHAYEENGKRYSKPVVNGEYAFKDGKLIITFPAAEVYALDGFQYAGGDGGKFYVFRDDGSGNSTRKVFLPFTASDLIVNDDTAIAESNLTNDYGIGYRSSSFDLQYFTPKTDDYIITAWDNADSGGNPTQTNALFSFDEKGNCVQYVTRVDIPVGENIGVLDVSAIAGENGYYHDGSAALDTYNNRIFGAKLYILALLAKDQSPEMDQYVNFQAGLHEGARVYCSKPVTTDQTITNDSASYSDTHLDVISAYMNELNVGQDYFAMYTATQTVEELVENRFIKYTDKGEEITQDYRLWPRLSWEEILVVDYDASGNIKNQYHFRIFEDPAMIPYFAYYWGLISYKWETPDAGPVRYPSGLSDSPINVVIDEDFMEHIPVSWMRFGDNILCQSGIGGSSDDLYTDKVRTNFYSSVTQGIRGDGLAFSHYLSMEYLTQSQIDALGLKKGIFTYR